MKINIKTKLYVALILALGLSIDCFSQQWLGPNYSTSNIRRTGRVGIGLTTSPTQRLQLSNGNMLFDIGSSGTTGNLYFGGITDALQSGMRLSYQQGFNNAYLDVRSPLPNQGLVFRVDNLNGGTERMRINANGNIGINEPSPTFRLHVQGNGHISEKFEIGGIALTPGQLSVLSKGTWPAISTFSPSSGGYLEGTTTGLHGIGGTHASGPPFPVESFGVWGASGGLASNKSVGVHGDGIGSQFAIGLWGQAMGGTISNYGVWGDLPLGNGYAGYFSGDVYSTGAYLPSDSKLKSGLKPYFGALASLKRINIYQFNFKTDEYPSLRLPNSQQIGLMAEEIEPIFPEFIKQTIQPTQIDTTGKIVVEAVQLKSVNYDALIPVLIQAIKEQQTEIEALRREVEELKLEKNKRKSRKK